MRIAHVVVTDAFAGAERYVCDVANEQAARGHVVHVVGGEATRMRALLTATVRHHAGGQFAQAAATLGGTGRHDIVHAHMTAAEAVALVDRPVHRARLVCTRHFAQPRGSGPLGRAVTPLLRRVGARQVAISGFVAARLEAAPDLILCNGVTSQPDRPRTPSRRVLVAQRLSAEKDTPTALRAWQTAGLAEQGWTMEVAGEGTDRAALERLAAELGITGSTRFVGFDNQLGARMQQVDVLVATAPAEPLGLSVLEAMAGGLAVVAAAAGGHLETVGSVDGARLFAAGDSAALAEQLVALAADPVGCAAYGQALREVQRRCFTIERHVDLLLAEYTR